MEKKLVHSLAEMDAFAESFLLKLEKNKEGATLVTLKGELGAGKTAFVKACAQGLDIKETITSPTFVLEKIYKLEDKAFGHLIHIDSYRLESGSELAKIGFAEILKDKNNIIFLEWPEIVEDVLPKESINLKFKFINEGVREIEYASN